MPVFVAPLVGILVWPDQNNFRARTQQDSTGDLPVETFFGAAAAGMAGPAMAQCKTVMGAMK
jgi:hypothetical protein